MSAMRSVSVAGILGFIGVALGAFGAHGLKEWLATLPDGAQRADWWGTGVEYQLCHALLLVGIGLWRRAHDARPLRIASALVVVGTVLFSGSLYAMTLSGIHVLGAITPLGGLAFLGAWACVAVAARRTNALAP
jgi:uncharacterized membrane protein YgdD (TMEM256/DUF423 family)